MEVGRAVVAAFLAAPLFIQPALAELDPAFLEGCKQSAMGFDEAGARAYCACMDHSIRSAKLGGEGSTAYMLALVSARDPAVLQKVTPSDPARAKIMFDYVAEISPICLQAAIQGKVQPDGSVKD